MASSSGLRAAGWPVKCVIIMWSLVVAASATAATAGFVLLDPVAGIQGVSLPFFRLRRKPAALDGMQSAHAPSGAARYARLTQPGAAGRLRLLGPEGKSSALAFAAGALLTILCDTMLPEAFDELRDWTGALVVTGFAGSLAISALWDQNAS